MTTVAVVGASGYTGAETLRWCLSHPRLTVVGATSRQHAGKRLRELWPQLPFDVPIFGTLDELPQADVLFLCLPHGEAARLAPGLKHALVIDLSGDHRLPEPEHGRAYGFPRAHAPWVYGLPELGAERILGATRIANPGCFATALALALLPGLGSAAVRIHAVGLTGSTGSGATPSAGTHHPLRAENLRPYKVLAHQHVPEVIQAVRAHGGPPLLLDFVPISAPVRRGILVTAHIPGARLGDYQSFYHGNPLVRVLDHPPELLHVLGTPRADIGVCEPAGGSHPAGGSDPVVFCAIDNLCRGAGSQAVANLNLAHGWPVDLGLRAPGPVP